VAFRQRRQACCSTLKQQPPGQRAEQFWNAFQRKNCSGDKGAGREMRNFKTADFQMERKVISERFSGRNHFGDKVTSESLRNFNRRNN